MAGDVHMIPAQRGCPSGVYVCDAVPFLTNPAVTGRPWGTKRLPS